MKVYFERRILVGFIVAFAILALLGVYTYRYDKESRVTTMQVAHTNEVLYHIEQLNSTALRLEKELHEFALTGDTAFNSIYKKELLTAAHHAGMLAKMVSDNPAQLSGLDSVRLLGREKVGFIKKVVAAGTVSADARRTLIPSEENTRLSNLLAGVIARMEDREKILLRQHTEASQAGIQSHEHLHVAAIRVRHPADPRILRHQLFVPEADVG